MQKWSNLHNSKGQALIFVTMMLFVVLFIATSTLARRAQNTTTTHGSTESNTSFLYANSGIQEAKNFLTSLPFYAVDENVGQLIDNTRYPDSCQTRTATNNCFTLNVNTAATANFFMNQGTSLYVNLTNRDSTTGAITTCITCSLKVTTSVSGVLFLITFYNTEGDYFKTQFGTTGGIVAPYKFEIPLINIVCVNKNCIHAIQNRFPEKASLTVMEDTYVSVVVE